MSREIKNGSYVRIVIPEREISFAYGTVTKETAQMFFVAPDASRPDVGEFIAKKFVIKS